MSTTLTDRYIAAVVRTLPPDTQNDVSAELAASIADNIEARLEQGEDHAAAEHTVLTAMGDPDALAASYVDRPLHLIGPRYYLTWWRLLKLLWVIVPITGAAGVLVAQTLADATVPEIIGNVVAVALAAFVHVAFWVTLVFVILERTGSDAGVKWSVDSLPEPQETGAGRGELIASLVFLGLAATALLWDRHIGFVFNAPGGIDITAGLGGQTTAMPILAPELWPWWVGAIFALIVLEAALAIAVYASHGWTAGLAWLNTLISVVFLAIALYLLLTNQLVNPQFVEFVFGRIDPAANVGTIVAAVAGVGLTLGTGWGVYDGWRKVRAAR